MEPKLRLNNQMALVETSTKDSGKFKTPFAKKYKGMLANKVTEVDGACFEALSKKYL